MQTGISNRKANRKWRKAGLFGKATAAKRKAKASVDLRVNLKDIMQHDKQAAQCARKRYNALAGAQIRQANNLNGFWNANKTKGRKAVRNVPIEEYQGAFK